MNSPFTTFIASGKSPRVRFKQSPHLMAVGEWFLQIHSITFGQLTPINVLLLLGTNIIQPNQALQRQVPESQQKVTVIQPLKVFQLDINPVDNVDNTKYIQDLTRIDFNDGLFYKVNRVKDYIEFYVEAVTLSELPPELENIPIFIHASLFKK